MSKTKKRGFVVRSMSTTDAPECRPYHVYLMPEHARAHAFWSNYFRAAVYETRSQAFDQIRRFGLAKFCATPQVVDIEEIDDTPNYWDQPNADREAALAPFGITPATSF